MKKVLLYIPVVLSILVLGAHFLRYGSSIGVFASLVLIGLLFVRRPWVLRLMQVFLVLGALEWVRTMYELAHMRALHGQPYGRMLVILGIVATVTLCSALLFQSATLKKRYGLERQE
jgi:cellulose synthase/poly-beta-1,6-N-acetylglucosamine synthase-like glycosyltransferase